MPFTCQGNENGLVIEGGATLGWELLDQLGERGSRLDRLVVQVGGGALASGLALAVDDAVAAGSIDRRPRFDTVQTTGAEPLARAYARVAGRLGATPGMPIDLAHQADALAEIAHQRSRYMWPWETEPRSVAGGILDDETYDWLAVVRAMLASGGRPITVDEATLVEAERLGRQATGIDADATGSSGLAGLVQLARDGHLAADEQVAVIFSGIQRHDAASTTADQPSRKRDTNDRSTS